MDTFFRTHQYLVEHTDSPVRRQLMDEIRWDDRLIGIKGSRGVGKSTFLLQYAKDNYSPDDRSCLYINMNHLYFTRRSLFDFADEFQKKGGKVLLIDQVFKYPGWSKEIRSCYDQFPHLRIVFTGSSTMRLKEENPELDGKVVSYNLRGLSFREYINLQTGSRFVSYTWDQILSHHREIALEITQKVKPLAYMQDYLHHGYYPFFLEKRNFSENLLKTINMMLEVDILIVQQIELKYLWKIKSLLYLLSQDIPCSPNVSKLSVDIETSRATVMNYIKYLTDARLINLLYADGESFPKKPGKIYLQNTNLIYAFQPQHNDRSSLCHTFAYNTLNRDNKMEMPLLKEASFLVNRERHIRIAVDEQLLDNTLPILTFRDMLEIGSDKEIPLWLLGFLY